MCSGGREQSHPAVQLDFTLRVIHYPVSCRPPHPLTDRWLSRPCLKNNQYFQKQKSQRSLSVTLARLGWRVFRPHNRSSSLGLKESPKPFKTGEGWGSSRCSLPPTRPPPAPHVGPLPRCWGIVTATPGATHAAGAESLSPVCAASVQPSPPSSLAFSWLQKSISPLSFPGYRILMRFRLKKANY